MEQADLLRHVVEALEDLGIGYMVVGSIASAAWGEPRSTLDIDVVVALQPGQVRSLCGKFPAVDYYVSEQAAVDAVRQNGQFNVIHPASGNKVDFIVARHDPWGRSQFMRKTRGHVLPDLDANLATPEDIIISKMAYYREGGSEKHLRDITGILRTSGDQVDRSYVAEWAAQLGLSEVWHAILSRLEEGT